MCDKVKSNVVTVVLVIWNSGQRDLQFYREGGKCRAYKNVRPYTEKPDPSGELGVKPWTGLLRDKTPHRVSVGYVTFIHYSRSNLLQGAKK